MFIKYRVLTSTANSNLSEYSVIISFNASQTTQQSVLPTDRS